MENPKTINIPDDVSGDFYNFDSALHALEKLVDSYISDVYIPSTEETIKIKEINANQQKDLLSSALDNSLYNTNFIKILYGILKDIIGEDKLKTYTIFDKAALVMSIRSQVSKTLKVKFPEKEENVEMEIYPILKRFETHYKHPSSTIVKDSKIQIEINVPSIFTEKDYEEEVHRKEKKIEDIKSTNDIKEVISKEFLGELSKFIKSVSIEENSIDFENLTFPQRTRLVERIPSSLVQEILNHINKWKGELDEVLTVKDAENQKTVIKIDPLLFVN